MSLHDLGIPVIVMEPVKGGSWHVCPMISIRFSMKWIPVHLFFLGTALGRKPAECQSSLSGMSAPEHVRENCSIFEKFEPLNEEALSAIRKASDMFRNRIRNGCTGCKYCMPCPAGVNIPENFKIWNEYGMFENVRHTRWWWNESLPADAKADRCVECGQCEAACPQGLSIIEDLKTLQAEIENAIR